MQCSIVFSRGSQTLNIHVPQNQNCAPLRTPKEELYPLCVPPNDKVSPYKSIIVDIFFFWVVFPSLRPPPNYLGTPRRTHSPGWEPLVYLIGLRSGFPKLFSTAYHQMINKRFWVPPKVKKLLTAYYFMIALLHLKNNCF